MRSSLAVTAATLLLVGTTPLALAAPQAPLPSCSQHHPGRQHRLESVVKQGDSRMTRSVAGHITLYAIERYSLKPLVNDSTYGHAAALVTSYLKVQYGNPAAVAAQFVSAGYQHFDRSHVDEAAAALLGFDLPHEASGRAVFQLPPQLVDLWAMTEKLQNSGKAYLLQSFFHIPPALTKAILDFQTEQEAKLAKRVGFNIPKGYDFPNGLITAAIAARRDPQATRARFVQAVADAGSR